ncbi:bifunctional adenosylcobinamide kinase/adenosylcobinamide-phosphate guanylyltransferase [Nocardioides piscis]|uniref:Adenosylcobinamide kinase n=1 Tax=Nocardioides piscis TaxID=2714938 RepID=A0A6G7YI85_9ACTN|nr:bifunctional adenosylcobinamide kinase/adenosylcobinamide-phosphate guanylyltransferase [Nocardioides piscis]QIK76449.1 bifunctional adenosylcobinamide kinase/adenosylcobinamide-phosphate guanylyltransferase [Nocardioides piscis]
MALTFLTGGARSGKSARAVLMASASDRPVTFIATARAGDAEMADRIRLHRAERPARWETVEAPLDLGAAVAGVGAESVGIIDCLSLWVANLLERGDCGVEIEAAAERVAAACAASRADWIVVSNEVGMGLVPMHPLGRDYRDRLGRVNATFSRHASLAQLMVAGRALTLGDHNHDLDLITRRTHD